jgi:hypothetical protein
VTGKNPTTQALVECLHLTLDGPFCTSIYSIDDWHKDINHLLQSCAWAMPDNSSQLVFGMYMIFREQAKIDGQLLKCQQHVQAIANKKKENKNCVPHEYKIGDLVLIVQKSYEHKRKAKLSSPTEGPFPIVCTYTNINVCIKRGNYEEDVSICRICPYNPANSLNCLDVAMTLHCELLV